MLYTCVFICILFKTTSMDDNENFTNETENRKNNVKFEKNYFQNWFLVINYEWIYLTFTYLTNTGS